MRNTQTTAHLPRVYSTSHAQKALNRIRVYVRFRAHVTVFCLSDGESRSAFDGPKPLIARHRRSDSAYGPCYRKINSAPTTDRETVWRRRSEVSLWSFKDFIGPNPNRPLRGNGSELNSPSNMFFGLPLRFKSVLRNSGRICLASRSQGNVRFASSSTTERARLPH